MEPKSRSARCWSGAFALGQAIMKTMSAGSIAPYGSASAAKSERRVAAIRHLMALAEIAENESQSLLQSAGDVMLAPAGTELLRAGAELNQPRVILSGWAGLSVFLPDGRRQFLDFALPGDLLGFSLRPAARAKAGIVCLTQVETVKVPALVNCIEAPERLPGLLHVLQIAQDQFEDRLLNQIVRNGCQTALEKLCSLLLELYLRLNKTGLAEHGSFELPISQVVIADALGLSTVHVNRTFQQLKRDGIVQSEGHLLSIVNFPVLRRLAGRISGANGSLKHLDQI
jgi:CRP-like cAMP-binding protein